MHIVAAKKAVRRAFRLQMEGRCFSLVEVLSTCPTNWGVAPTVATKWLADNMIPYYPLGTFKDPDQEVG
jgi:2-oxoglutarate ferredoxin oxidoreductase subunit beta